MSNSEYFKPNPEAISILKECFSIDDRYTIVKILKKNGYDTDEKIMNRFKDIKDLLLFVLDNVDKINHIDYSNEYDRIPLFKHVIDIGYQNFADSIWKTLQGDLKNQIKKLKKQL